MKKNIITTAARCRTQVLHAGSETLHQVLHAGIALLAIAITTLATLATLASCGSEALHPSFDADEAPVSLTIGIGSGAGAGEAPETSSRGSDAPANSSPQLRGGAGSPAEGLSQQASYSNKQPLCPADISPQLRGEVAAPTRTTAAAFKTHFVPGDVITLQYVIGNGGNALTAPYTLQTDGTWQQSATATDATGNPAAGEPGSSASLAALALPTDGTDITVQAVYGNDAPDDISNTTDAHFADILYGNAGTTANSPDGTFTLAVKPGSGASPVWNIDLRMRHRRAVVDISLFNERIQAIDAKHFEKVSITILEDPTVTGTTEEPKTYTVHSTSPADIILPEGYRITKVTTRTGGIDYTVTLPELAPDGSSARPLLASGTRYTLAFVCHPKEPAISLTAADGTEVLPPNWAQGGAQYFIQGYDYIIKDLASLLAWHADVTHTNAATRQANLKKKAIQLADIVWPGSEALHPSLPDGITFPDDGLWVPVGYSTTDADNDPDHFTGLYNGNGYTITGLRIGSVAAGTNTHSGMFGAIGPNAVLASIHLRGASIAKLPTSGDSQVGLLVGVSNNENLNENQPVISLCSAQGFIGAATETITTMSFIGGLAGGVANTHITRCYAEVTIKGIANNDAFVGGLVGGNMTSTIVACGATADISLTKADESHSIGYSAGGLVGYNQGTIALSYAKGTVSVEGNSASRWVGGLAGSNAGGNIAHSYATAAATGTPDSGTDTPNNDGYTSSFVGTNYSIIARCHATGLANGEVDALGVGTGSNTLPTDGNFSYLNTRAGREAQIAPATAYVTPAVRTVVIKPDGTYDLLKKNNDGTDGFSVVYNTATFSSTSVWNWAMAAPDINYSYNGTVTVQ